jgi:Cytochrome c
MTGRAVLGMIAAVLTLAGLTVAAAEPAGELPEAAARGRKALLERNFNPPSFSLQAYHNAWRCWDGLKEKPADYATAFMEHYGLHPAPYPNNDLPMGLRQASSLLGKGLTTDCLTCHAGSIAGQSYIGLTNASIDYQSLYEDLLAAEGRPPKTAFRFCNVRGTTEAGAMAVFLLALREPDLTVREDRPLDLKLHDDLCEDAPAWWLLKKKRTMYHTGSGDARSVRSLMQFMLSPLNPPSAFDREEPTFRDIQAYLLSLEPPRYPFPIDQELAHTGEKLFRDNCAKCHGTYGANWTYPNKIIPIDKIGTDPTRYRGISAEFGRYYNRSWFAHEQAGWLADEYPGRLTEGYQAPPLDGIWATASYFHNGSVPTVYHVLNSQARPRIFTRSYRTDRDAYDTEKLGWKVEVLEHGPDAELPAIERRKVYDTSQPGRGNGGHTFGDHLTEAERTAVIEYLKTL